MAAARKQFRGFTLVEMILVLLVIVICAMIAAPKLGDFARGRGVIAKLTGADRDENGVRSVAPG